MNSKESLTTGVVTVTTTDAEKPSTSSTIDSLTTLVSTTKYTPIEWVNGGVHPLSAENINRFEDSFTALIGDSSVPSKGGIIDKITEALDEEITDRVTDIKTIHTRLSKSELNIQTAVETESGARIQADAKLNERINKFDIPATPSTYRSQEDRLQVIKRIAVDTTPTNESDPYVTVETGDIELKEIDIPTLHTDKINLNDNSKSLTSKLGELDDSDTALSTRISKLTTTKVSVNDPTTSESGYCEVISSFEIADDTVTIETAPIALTNKDIPANISSDKIDVSENQTLTAELAKLNQSDIDIKAYIDDQLQEVTKGTMYWKVY